MNKLKKALASCSFLLATLLSQGVYAISIGEILSTDTRELSVSQHKNLIDRINAMGSLMMINIHTLSNESVMPGDLTPEKGLDYIPDEEDAIDIYVGLIEKGALPFGAVLLTNQMLFDL